MLSNLIATEIITRRCTGPFEVGDQDMLNCIVSTEEILHAHIHLATSAELHFYERSRQKISNNGASAYWDSFWGSRQLGVKTM